VNLSGQITRAETIAGHHVRAEACDGLAQHWRVYADGRFAGVLTRTSSDWQASCPLGAAAMCGHAHHSPSCDDALSWLLTSMEG
jgi:hypothetical protein